MYSNEHARYNPDTGVITRIKNGSVFGSERKGKGYIVGTIGGKFWYAHRLAWTIVNGSIPDGMQIDHINGVRSDNRLVNLRLVTINDNMRNRAASRRRLPGVTGVTFSKSTPTKPWKVMIYENNKHINVGYFSSFVRACEERIIAEVLLGYDVNHGVRKITYE